MRLALAHNCDTAKTTPYGVAVTTDIYDDVDPELQHVQYSLQHHYYNSEQHDTSWICI